MSQPNATIFSLQSYVTELTCYINENNAKYTKNLETLKTFYQTQLQDLERKLTTVQDESHLTRNQLLATRDLLHNRQKEMADLKEKCREIGQENECLREKLHNERQKIDHLYEEMERSKKQFNSELSILDKTIKQTDSEKNDIILKLKQKQHQISRLGKDIQRLHDQVSERYSLPQKLKDIEIEYAKDKTLLQTLSQTKKELETKLDFQSNEIERLRKQNKKLEVGYDTTEANGKRQLSEALTKERQLTQEKHKRLESANEKQLFQINQLHNSLKSLKKQNSQLESKLNDYIEECRHLQQRIGTYDQDKDRYIEEFQKLKREYEQVIRNLQEAIPKYQKKNWDLEQENRDLNVQLDGLRDLLNEIRAMNSLQPLKQEYRQIAELQLLAQADYKKYKQEREDINHKQREYTARQRSPSKEQSDDDFKWDKLLAEIDNIQVS